MALNFPGNPTLDQVYTDEVSGGSWKWDGVAWIGVTREETDLGPVVSLCERDLNLYVATTGNDETGDGTQALPWATPHRAMAYLSRCVLASGVTATVNVADGTYTFTQPLNLNHSQGTQIFINGTSTTGTRPTGFDLDGNGVTGNTDATRAFNRAKLDAYYNTRWLFNNSMGLKCSAGGGVTVDKVLIAGDNTGAWGGVVAGNRDPGALSSAAGSGVINLGSTVAVHGFTQGGVTASQGGCIFADYVTVTNCANGMRANQCSTIRADYATANCNTQVGIAADGTSQIQANYAIAARNSSYGILSSNTSFVTCSDAQSNDNGSHGYFSLVGSAMIANRTTANNNTTTPYNAANGSVISARFTLTYTGTPSPALNTTGNNNSLIYTVN